MMRNPSPPGRAAAAALAVLVAGILPLAAQEAAPEPSATLDAPEYVIGVEDVLTVSVWGETGMTRKLTVRPDGKVSFDLVGDLQAAGRTPMDLDARITEGLRKFIQEPYVTVIVDEINSFKVFLVGEFTTQGELILRRRTRLLEAIALGGGLTEFAKVSNLQIVREEEGREARLRIDYRKVLSGERPDLNVYLRPGDTIIAY